MTTTNSPMAPMVATLSHGTSVTLAEVGFLLILFAGLCLVAAEIPKLGISKARRIIAGTALALADVVLGIAIHWGQFG